MGAQREPEHRFEPDGESSEEMLRRLSARFDINPREDTTPLHDILKGLEQPEPSTTQNPVILPGSLTDHDWADIHHLLFANNTQSDPTVHGHETTQTAPFTLMKPGLSTLARFVQKRYESEGQNMPIMGNSSSGSYSITIKMSENGDIPSYSLTVNNEKLALLEDPIDVIAEFLLDALTNNFPVNKNTIYPSRVQIKGCIRAIALNSELRQENDQQRWVIPQNRRTTLVLPYLSIIQNQMRTFNPEASMHIEGLLEACVRQDADLVKGSLEA